MVFSFLIIYFFYAALFGKSILLNYTREQILTYVLGISLVRALVLSSRTIDLGSVIANADLANYLLKPFGFFKYWFTRDFADKLANTFCSFFEITILFFLLRPQIFIQSNPLLILFFFLSLILSTFLYFFINTFLGLLAFWTPESWTGIWAPRFLFFILLEFFSGTLFPLDFLPLNLFNIFFLTPFPYLVYFPLKVYLGNTTTLFILKGFFICLFWCFLSFLIVKKTWEKGLKVFSAEGR